VSDLDAALVGVVLGLAGVGAVLLRNEERVRMAWRQRRGDSDPKAGGIRVWMLVFEGLIASVNLGLGVPAGDVFHIVMGALWLLFFSFSLRSYRRSRSSQDEASVP
jgi:hypothetical protein